jgi:hypothetical protein
MGDSASLGLGGVSKGFGLGVTFLGEALWGLEALTGLGELLVPFGLGV